ncbi:MAG TPA: FecR domain-containing protein [Pirellulales bacterium]
MAANPAKLTAEEWSELHRLVSAVCDGQADGALRARLEQLVLSHDEARAFYVQYIHMHAAVVRYNLSVEPGDVSVAQGVSVASDALFAGSEGDAETASNRRGERTASPILGFLSESLRSVLPAPSSFSLLGAALVASVAWALIAIWIVPWWRAQSPDAPGSMSSTAPIGRLTGAENCRWGADAAPQVGAALELAPLDIAAGTAQIALAGGAKVWVEGPARLQLESPGRVRLEHGKLFASVPKKAIGFTVVTPSAEVVDRGTEFAVDVDTAGKTEVHTLRGKVEVKPTTEKSTAAGRRAVSVGAGQAVQILVDAEQSSPIPFDIARFDALRHSGSASVVASTGKPQSHGEFAGVVWLGNLFDDPRGTPLADAVRTDEFRAVAEVGDLGVDRVLLGGDALKQISSGVRFDFSNLGWGPGHYGQISNDTWTDYGVLPGADFGPDGGIQTLGQRIGMKEPKIEDGIGSHASALVTFNLDEIRLAGDLGDRPLVFRCDRAGINDSFAGAGSVHMAVLAGDRRGVTRAIVDGEPAQVAEKAGVWSIRSAIGASIGGNGRFVKFELPLAAEVKFLTLAVTQADGGNGCDAAVWSGARLEAAR